LNWESSVSKFPSAVSSKLSKLVFSSSIWFTHSLDLAASAIAVASKLDMIVSELVGLLWDVCSRSDVVSYLNMSGTIS